MNDLRLTIDLLPKGAWGNNFSKTLPKKDWDTLRHNCYERANHRCSVCGKEEELDAHEVWDFDIIEQIQTLKNIIALCSACHGVKHMRHSERIGYGENAKQHFLRQNNCDPLAFARHYTDAQLLFEQRNEVLRWKMQADLESFGGYGIEIKHRDIPLIKNPYDGINWETADHERMQTDGTEYATVLVTDENTDRKAKYFTSSPRTLIGTPKIRLIAVNNYQGTITVVCDDTKKIEWVCGEEIIKTKYNCTGKFIAEYSVESLENSSIRFRLTGDGGETLSQEFRLARI
jgi:hypothetical protein